ncbi:hypothetical protein [Gemmatimonas sp.]|uniref:hypothetical protein n=1 Tax=Gemmatimonas sp. TaxID=1962908 RepID=UPI003983B788
MRFARYAGVAALVLSAASARAEAQLPTVQQVFDNFATAVGGRDAWSKVQGRSDKGTADITFAGISGTYERHSGAPNKMRMIIDLGMAKVDQGFDGTMGWAVQPTGQASRMPAEQEKSLGESIQVGAAFLDVSRFAKASVDAKEAFDGVECYKLSITSKLGEERTEYFEVATGLRRGAVTKTPMGPQKSMFREYKAFEGKQIPTKIVQSTPQGDVILTTAEVSFTLPDPSLFKAPDGIAK